MTATCNITDRSLLKPNLSNTWTCVMQKLSDILKWVGTSGKKPSNIWDRQRGGSPKMTATCNITDRSLLKPNLSNTWTCVMQKLSDILKWVGTSGKKPSNIWDRQRGGSRKMTTTCDITDRSKLIALSKHVMQLLSDILK